MLKGKERQQVNEREIKIIQEKKITESISWRKMCMLHQMISFIRESSDIYM